MRYPKAVPLLGALLAAGCQDWCPSGEAPEVTPAFHANSGRNQFRSQVSPNVPDWEAYVVKPGTTVEAWNFDSELTAIHSVQLGIYQAVRYDTGSVDDWGSPVFLPLEHEWTGESTPLHDVFEATLPDDVEGLPAGPAFLKVTYEAGADTREAWVGARQGSTATPAAFYFVPDYVLNLAEVEIPLGSDAGDHLVQDTVFLNAGWVPFLSKFWVIDQVAIQSGGFPGDAELAGPFAGRNQPTQGYRVQMPALGSGVMTIHYHIIGPRGLTPEWASEFASFGVLGAFEDSVLAGPALIEFGMPTRSGDIRYLPNGP